MKKSYLLVSFIITGIFLFSCRFERYPRNWYFDKETGKWKRFPWKEFPRRIEIKYPVLEVNEDFSKIIDTVLHLTKRCNGLSYRQVKGFYVSALNKPYYEGKERKKVFTFQSVPDFMVLSYQTAVPTEVKGLLIKDQKLFMFVCSGFDKNYMKETGDSLKLELKFSRSFKTGRMRYKITKIGGEIFEKRRFHWYISLQNMEELSIDAFLDYDGTWLIHRFCYRINPLVSEGKERPRIMGKRFGVICIEENTSKENVILDTLKVKEKPFEMWKKYEKKK